MTAETRIQKVKVEITRIKSQIEFHENRPFNESEYKMLGVENKRRVINLKKELSQYEMILGKLDYKP